MDDGQLSLSVVTMVLDERQRAELDAALAAAEAEQEIPARTRKKPTGRKPLIQILPPEVEREDLDAFERIARR